MLPYEKFTCPILPAYRGLSWRRLWQISESESPQFPRLYSTRTNPTPAPSSLSRNTRLDSARHHVTTIKAVLALKLPRGTTQPPVLPPVPVPVPVIPQETQRGFKHVLALLSLKPLPLDGKQHRRSTMPTPVSIQATPSPMPT